MKGNIIDLLDGVNRMNVQELWSQEVVVGGEGGGGSSSSSCGVFVDIGRKKAGVLCAMKRVIRSRGK